MIYEIHLEKDIGKFLRLLRQSRALEISELAERSGVTATCLRNIENNKNIPTKKVLIKLSNFYGIDEAVFFDEANLIF